MDENAGYLVHSEQAGSQVLTTLTIGRDITLGRDVTCGVVLRRSDVSREHARIRWLDGKPILEDLNSRNGTFVNGSRIQTHALIEGDVLTFCDPHDQPLRFTARRPDVTIASAHVYDFSSPALNDVSNLMLLMRINRAISASTDLEEVMELVLQGVLGISQGARAIILLKDDAGRLEPAYHKYVDGGLARGSGRPYSSTVVERVVRTRSPVLIGSLQQLPELAAQQSIREQSLESVAAIPLFSSQAGLSDSQLRDDLLGVVYVDNQVARRAFTTQDVELLTAFSLQAAISVEKALLHRNLQNNYIQSVSALCKAVEIKDRYTGGHSLFVAQYALAIAEPLNLSEREYADIVRGGMLHDVGKIGIDGPLLNKPGKLTDAEYETIKQHPSFGGEILAPISFMPTVNDIVVNHHQRLDGTGYPNGLTGAQLSLGARLVAVADIFEAITADRAYRAAMPAERVVAVIEQEAKKHIDPDLARRLLEIYRSVSYEKSAIAPQSKDLQDVLRRFIRL